MNEGEHHCLVCEKSSREVPLLKLEYQEREYWICSQDFPILIHQPQKLAGVLPGAEKLPGHEE